MAPWVGNDRKGMFFVGLSSATVLMAFLWMNVSPLHPHYDSEQRALAGGHIFVCQMRMSQGSLKSGDVVIARACALEDLDAGDLWVLLLWQPEASAFVSVDQGVSSASLSLMMPSEIRRAFLDVGYEAVTGVLRPREMPVINDNYRFGEGVRLASKGGTKYSCGVSLGDGSDGDVCHATLFYNDDSVKIVAHDYGSGAGADTELIYSIVLALSGREPVIHYYAMRGVSYGILD